MTETSGFWETTDTPSGHQVAEYTEELWSLPVKILTTVRGYQGVSKGYLNDLAGTAPGANSVSINSGGCVGDGRWYNNSAPVGVNIPSAVGGGNTRIDRIVVRFTWASYTGVITRIAGVDAGSPTAPAITQNSGSVWDIMLYQALVDTSGNVTLTDERLNYNVLITVAELTPRTRSFIAQPANAYYMDNGGTKYAFTDVGMSGYTTGWGIYTHNTYETTMHGWFQVPQDYVSDMKLSLFFINHDGLHAQQIVSNFNVHHGNMVDEYEQYLNNETNNIPPITAVLANQITLTNLTKGDWVVWYAQRDPYAINDTADGAFLCFSGVWVEYTADS